MKVLTRSTPLLLAILVHLALSVLTPAALAQCASCDESDAQDPFESYQAAFSPYTLGLPTGEIAPQIPGIAYAASPTVLVVVPGGCDPEYLPLLSIWSQIEGLQVVYARPNVTASSMEREVAALGEEVVFLASSVASIVCAQFQVGNRPSPVTFLIGADGMILYRRRGFPNYAALKLTQLVEHLAAHGEILADTLPQHVLWKGDVVPEALGFLHDLEGEPEALIHGQPTLIYSGSNTPGSRPAYDATTALMDQFPNVRFVMVLHYKTEESLASIWEFGQLIALDRVHPEWFAITLDEFMVKVDAEGIMAELSAQALQAEADGWEVVLDPDNQLTTFWLLYAVPSVMIYDGSGVVVFPPTAYSLLTDADTGLKHLAEGTSEALVRALSNVQTP